MPYQTPRTTADAALLRPVVGQMRGIRSLDGFWRFAIDAEGEGEAKRWQEGLPGSQLVAVPGAINEQIIGAASYTGPAWYETQIDAPALHPGRRHMLRFDAATLVATVWLDGELLGTHAGGFLPFAFDVTERLRSGARHRLTARVEHGLSLQRTPVGGRPMSSAFQSWPPTSFDFFPFSGLIRPVRLLDLPTTAIADVTVQTEHRNGQAQLFVDIEVPGFEGAALVRRRGSDIETRLAVSNGHAGGLIEWSDARLWSTADPHLEDIEVVLLDGSTVIDSYVQPVGVRTVEVEGTKLLLNDAPIELRGFGKHEDFPVFGRGLATPVVVRDAELMRWLGANSYRTSHYPYAEEALELADRQGILVISETSAVGLNFYNDPENFAPRLDFVRAELDALIRRDRNHPSVIAWSVANEPFAKPIFQPGAVKPEALATGIGFLGTLIADAKRLDPSRPTMVVGAQGHPDEFTDLGDIIGINRYYGWYSESGRLEAGAAKFGAELDSLKRFGKPILVAEFGTDTLPGSHAVEPEMWTEEYQAEFIERYLDEIEARDWVVGAHIWNFADFKTSQSILRAGGLNHKGVFTRDRRPKLAAHLLRRRWFGKP